MTPEDEELIRSYRLTFGPPWGQAVLLDLMKFCNFRIPLADDNLEIAEGMRRVFLRIAHFSKLTPEQLLHLVAGQPIPTSEMGEMNDE